MWGRNKNEGLISFSAAIQTNEENATKRKKMNNNAPKSGMVESRPSSHITDRKQSLGNSYSHRPTPIQKQRQTHQHQKGRPGKRMIALLKEKKRRVCDKPFG